MVREKRKDIVDRVNADVRKVVQLPEMKDRFAGVRAYVAGPPPMVDASLRLLLREARLPPADIRYDKFS